ncbi:hypothetical protein EO244_02660 [Ancylomarina salipaludis]|uniref:Uncharacterized protein n=1 Tax=Ancylomarina salipaludis TaxID=2501299 RepID=A0A4Q1JNR9_9BACT|nr:hypothetical protein [Ancylomarina salipaludis]RXQ96550.1 hypothetical protein EO244_02660 [Ancylomarina salipaludis]
MGVSFYKFRQEELPVVGELLLQMFVRDRSAFEKFSPEYKGEFLMIVENQIQKVLGMTQAATLRAEIKKKTADLYNCVDEIIPILDLIAAYAKRAGTSLSIKASDFGVMQAKKEIRKRNIEGVCTKVKVVEQNIANNLSALKERGYTEELGAELIEMTQKAYKLNLIQEEKIREKKQLVVDNMTEYTLLWCFLKDLSETGRLLMKADQQKCDGYKFSHIIKQVRKTKPNTDNTNKGDNIKEKLNQVVVPEEV